MLYLRKLADGDGMLDKCGSRIAGVLCDNRIIREEDKVIIVYGLDALLSTLINLVIILGLGLILGQLRQTVVFLLSFAALASRFTSCIIIVYQPEMPQKVRSMKGVGSIINYS